MPAETRFALFTVWLYAMLLVLACITPTVCSLRRRRSPMDSRQSWKENTPGPSTPNYEDDSLVRHLRVLEWDAMSFQKSPSSKSAIPSRSPTLPSMVTHSPTGEIPYAPIPTLPPGEAFCLQI